MAGNGLQPEVDAEAEKIGPSSSLSFTDAVHSIFFGSSQVAAGERGEDPYVLFYRNQWTHQCIMGNIVITNAKKEIGFIEFVKAPALSHGPYLGTRDSVFVALCVQRYQ
ncbi:hypothetical protein K1719_022742 [Acacia pycnantha]|nr:hypothetical protein K1719_022742 [Acacia pycnantha]